MPQPQFKKTKPWVLFLVLLLVGGITGGTWVTLTKAKNLKNILAEFILDNPETTAVVAYTVDEDGAIIDDGYDFFYNADQPLVVASTMKIIILAAYADAIANGELDPNEQVSVADWERYYLPMTDGGAHIAGLKSLGLESDDYGFSLDQAATLTLDDLARIMIHYSGNAATDFLLERLGKEKVASVMLEAGLGHHTPIEPTLGVALAGTNHENPSPSLDQLQSLNDVYSDRDTSAFDSLIQLYLYDSSWRTAQIDYLTSSTEPSTGSNEQEIWSYYIELSRLLPKGTAREYAHLMAQIASGNFISMQVSTIMQQMLESVPSDWPLRTLFYDRFGAKDGITAGVLTLASYSVPKRGPLAGQTRVVVILTNQQPLEIWSAQVPFEGHYLLQIDLAKASGVFDQLAELDAASNYSSLRREIPRIEHAIRNAQVACCKLQIAN